MEEKLKDFGSMEENLSSISENIKVCDLFSSSTVFSW